MKPVREIQVFMKFNSFLKYIEGEEVFKKFILSNKTLAKKT